MSAEKVTDEMLMAYADGELEPPERERIAALARTDPAVAARIAAFMRTGLAARAAFAPFHAAPVPPALIAAVMGPESGRAQKGSWRGRALLPMAAALALAVGIGGGFLAGLAVPRPNGEGFSTAATGAPVLAALARTPSGERVAVSSGGRDLEVVATGTYAAEAGMCRTFEVHGAEGGLRGVTCRAAEGWTVPVTVLTGGEGYRLASESASAVIDLYLDETGVGADIGAEQEAALIARDWR